jgi:hypothetical protein
MRERQRRGSSEGLTDPTRRPCRWPSIETTVGILVIVACVIGLFVIIGKFAK